MAHCRISTETLLSIQNDIMKHGLCQDADDYNMAYFKGVNDTINMLLGHIQENNMSKVKGKDE